jgi:hypothetical protein
VNEQEYLNYLAQYRKDSFRKIMNMSPADRQVAIQKMIEKEEGLPEVLSPKEYEREKKSSLLEEWYEREKQRKPPDLMKVAEQIMKTGRKPFRVQAGSERLEVYPDTAPSGIYPEKWKGLTDEQRLGVIELLKQRKEEEYEAPEEKEARRKREDIETAKLKYEVEKEERKRAEKAARKRKLVTMKPIQKMPSIWIPTRRAAQPVHYKGEQLRSTAQPIMSLGSISFRMPSITGIWTRTPSAVVQRVLVTKKGSAPKVRAPNISVNLAGLEKMLIKPKKGRKLSW